MYNHGMDRVPIELDSFHHVYNRGVDKRLVFMDDEDRQVFLFYLNILNDRDVESQSQLVRAAATHEAPAPGRRLTDICAFCLMGNHFHLLLYECVAGGISKFMQRLGTAYTMYFNEKYERAGALFQGRFKSRYIDDLAYLMHAVDYMHINPIAHRVDGQMDLGLVQKRLAHLEKYRWSSYRDFCGQSTYPKILNLTVLKEYLDMPNDYRAWLRESFDYENIKEYTIDL